MYRTRSLADYSYYTFIIHSAMRPTFSLSTSKRLSNNTSYTFSLSLASTPSLYTIASYMPKLSPSLLSSNHIPRRCASPLSHWLVFPSSALTDSEVQHPWTLTPHAPIFLRSGIPARIRMMVASQNPI